MGLSPTPLGRGLTTVSRLTLGALIFGLVAGALLGRIAETALPAMLGIAAPIGKLWLDALTMTIVPLVFGLLVTGIASAAASAAGNGVATRAVLWFALLLVGACLVAAAATSLALHLYPVPAQAMTLHAATAPPELAAPSDWLTGFIPTNPIKAAADNAMVPLVVFALLVGLAVVRIEGQLQAAISPSLKPRSRRCSLSSAGF